MPKIAQAYREMRFWQKSVIAASTTIDHFLESFLEIPDFRQIADTNRYCCFWVAPKQAVGHTDTKTLADTLWVSDFGSLWIHGSPV